MLQEKIGLAVGATLPAKVRHLLAHLDRGLAELKILALDDEHAPVALVPGEDIDVAIVAIELAAEYPHKFGVRRLVNSELRQSSDTSKLVFDIW